MWYKAVQKLTNSVIRLLRYKGYLYFIVLYVFINSWLCFVQWPMGEQCLVKVDKSFITHLIWHILYFPDYMILLLSVWPHPHPVRWEKHRQGFSAASPPYQRAKDILLKVAFFIDWVEVACWKIGKELFTSFSPPTLCLYLFICLINEHFLLDLCFAYFF